MAMEMSLQRMADLERRVLALEERTRRSLWTREEELARKEEALVAQYGEYVDKTATAKILGVTRATVYAMLADGRIEGACSAWPCAALRATWPRRRAGEQKSSRHDAGRIYKGRAIIGKEG